MELKGSDINKIKPKIKCPNCKYEWETDSKLNYVTCPNCQRKFEKDGESKRELDN